MFIFLVLNILSVSVCYYIAKSRKAQSYFWAFMGAVFGPFAIPFIFLSKPEAEHA
ncbi:hypothetical protein ACOYR1_10530 [Thalassotalea piscium]